MRQEILFSRGSLYQLFKNIENSIVSEIEGYNEAKVNENIDNLCKAIYKKNSLEAPILDDQSIKTVEQGEMEVPNRGTRSTRKITYVKIEIPFSGDGQLFQFVPSQSIMTHIGAELFNDRMNLIYEMNDRTSAQIKSEMDRDIRDIKHNLANIQKEVAAFNPKINVLARENIERRKEKLKKDREVIEGIGFPFKDK